MKFQGFKRLILASVVAVSSQTISVDATSVMAETSAVKPSVQWAGGADEGYGLTPSRDLRWSKPKVKNSGAVVTAAHIAKSETSPIQQVQYSFAQNNTMTPAQRDTVYPELRPQSNTPPTGATLVPTVPSNPPSSFSTPTEPVKNVEPASLPMVSTPPKPTVEKKAVTISPTDFPKPESKAVELKTPDLTTDIPKKETEVGTAPAPEPTDTYTATRRGERKCPDKSGFKSIREISYDIRPMTGTPLPTDCPLITTTYNGRHFSRTCFQWKASALCTKAAYFEDVQLERYGHSMCPALQPVISGARFFLTVPMLPYQMGLTPPNECVYTLGHYRVGSCAPHMLDPLPISVRAVLFEAAAIGAGVAIIP